MRLGSSMPMTLRPGTTAMRTETALMRARHIVGEADHAAGLGAGRGLQFIERHHRTGPDLHDLALDAEILQHGFQQPRVLLQRFLVDALLPVATGALCSSSSDGSAYRSLGVRSSMPCLWSALARFRFRGLRHHRCGAALGIARGGATISISSSSPSSDSRGSRCSARNSCVRSARRWPACSLSRPRQCSVASSHRSGCPRRRRPDALAGRRSHRTKAAVPGRRTAAAPRASARQST